MKASHHVRALALFALSLVFAGCSPDPGSRIPARADPRDVIELRWVKGHERESRADVEKGLLWCLSLLGAQLPRDATILEWRDDRLTLDIARAGVIPATAPAWRELLAQFKDSGEYRAMGAVDIGRFVAISLGDPGRYYALTDAPTNYHDARARFRFDPRPAAIVVSAVARGGRRIEISRADTVEQIAFVAFEGEGDLAKGSFSPREMEIVDTLPNGQLRFALYGLDGRLKPGASAELTTAGKPAKCMWCHESKLQPTFIDFPAAPDAYDRREFDALVEQRRVLLDRHRSRLDTQIDYGNAQDHRFVELLYLTFEEPSRERLALEWGVTPERAAQRLHGKAVHAQQEFPWLGDRLYRRQDADALAPYEVLAAPPSVRELAPTGHGGVP